MNKLITLAAGLMLTLAGNAQTIDITYNCGGSDYTGTIEITGTQGNSTVLYDWTDSYDTYQCSTDLTDSCIVFTPEWMYCPNGTGAYVNPLSTCVLYADPALALFNTLFDPTSCTNGSAVSECYELGYETALAECQPDTVVVTDTVIVDISEESANYYINTIALLDSALTVVTDNCDDEIAALNDSINGLEQELYVANFTINITQSALDNCFEDNADLDAQIAAQDAAIDALNQLVADLLAQNDSLNNELLATIAGCEEDSALAALEVDSLELIIDGQEEAINTLTTVVLDLNDQVIDASTACQGTILELEQDILVLQGQLNDCADAVDYNAGLLNQCNADLDTAEDEVLYWMDAYADIVDACDSAVADATCGFACFETEEELAFFYDGAFYAGVLSVDCPEVPECDYNYGDVMAAFYNGYEEGLGDCEGTTGIDILDPSGNVLTQVTGYFNELGQVIDPRTYTGVIIRRHADGTFSKYYVQR